MLLKIKMIYGVIKEENNINWNLLNKVDNNQSFDYFGSINIHPISQIHSITSPVSSSKAGTNNTNSNTQSNKKSIIFSNCFRKY